MAVRRACCDISLCNSGFTLIVRDLDAIDRPGMVLGELPFSWDARAVEVERFLSTLCAEFDEIVTRAFLPNEVIIRGTVSDFVPERLREQTALKLTAQQINSPIEDLLAKFLSGKFARDYLVVERSSIRDIENYPLFRFLGVSAVCAYGYEDYFETIVLKVLGPTSFPSIPLQHLSRIPPP